MKHLLAGIILCGINLSADYIKKTIVVCAKAETVYELNEYRDAQGQAKESLDIELWLMNHECKVVDKKTKIEVLDYVGKKKSILKIELKESGEIMYAPNKGVEIEQPGQKNIIYKF